VSRPGEGGTHPPGGPQDEDGRRSEGEALGGVHADDGGGGNLSHVSITVDEEHLASLDLVVEALRDHGMHVDAVLESLGMVTGSTSDPAALREVEGVSGVDAELEHQLPPPEDEIQ
jgi:hypothetical protein